MHSYELNYLVSSSLSQEELQALQAEIVSFIQKNGGILIEEVKTTKTKLGREIKGKREAYLVTLNLQIEAGVLVNLEKTLKERSQILNCCLLTKKVWKKTPEIRKRMPTKLIKPKRGKVELKEIERKLEEILDET